MSRSGYRPVYGCKEEKYKIGSSSSLARSLDRHIYDSGKEYCILTDKQLEGCQQTLEVKREGRPRKGVALECPMYNFF